MTIKISKTELRRRKRAPKQLPGAKAHATYSASGASRWLACAGSTKLIEKAPPQEDNKYAEEGTQAHACLEFILGNRCSKASLRMALKKYNPEMVAHARFFAKYVLRRLAEYDGAELLIEERSNLPVTEPDQFGTADVCIVQPYGRLIVMDYKYGAGLPVSVDGNAQLAYYALGIAHKYGYDFADVEMVIGQPRAEIDGKKIRSIVTTIDDLKVWRNIFERGIQASKRKDAELNPGEHCRYCPAKIICPAISKKALEQARIDFTDSTGVIVAPKANEIAVPYLGKTLIACDALEIWIGAIRSYAYQVMTRGQKVEGFKLVPKRPSRKWVDAQSVEVEAKAIYGKKAFTKPELLSPAQLEKVSKDAKKFVLKNTSKVSSGLTLVPASDQRTGTNPASADFSTPVERTVKLSKSNAAKAKKALANLKNEK